MHVIFINSWLGNHYSNSKIKHMATCEYPNIKAISLLVHEIKNHKVDICCKLNPPNN
jgi:hypothetical protein